VVEQQLKELLLATTRVGIDICKIETKLGFSLSTKDKVITASKSDAE